MNFVNAVFPQKQAAVMCSGQQRRGIMGKQGLGVLIKGQRGSTAAVLCRQIAAGLQKRLMSQMDPVKEAQRVNSFLVSHMLTCSNLALHKNPQAAAAATASKVWRDAPAGNS